MIMGFYYSGTLDWSFTNEPITDLVSFVNNGIISDTYTLYANNHWRELIDKYKPLILWNDIGYPPNTNIFEIFAYFYNKFPDGVINDRWMQLGKRTRKVLKFPPIKTLVTWIVKRSMIKGGSSGLLPAHCDFITPEYASFHKIKKKKWESTRGIGNSFGFNQFETERDYLQSSEVIRMLVDIVSKNGNLLLNIGPMADGTIPDLQKKLLIELGAWLKKFGESIYETNPWIRAESVTSKGIPVRFTSKLDALYVFILNKPEEHRIKIKEVFLDEASEIKDLGTLKAIEWAQDNSDIVINTEEILFDSSAHVFKITPLPS
jgi:alpha-L-fucosidase